MLTDFLRTRHGFRSAEFIRNKYSNDKRLKVSNVNISELLAKLCASHCQSSDELTSQNGFNYDEQIGRYSINMPFLAIVLRLADILDFDRDRTPDSLYRSIHFTSEISIKEWEKHRGVQGWNISQNKLRFSMKFEHPVYEATARKFIDWIDKELFECHQICSQFPKEFSKYKLLLPQKVDRSRISPKNNSYIYRDLEFTLSRDEIIKLLMTDKLYNKPSLCIRELLQNSLDALRYRKAMHKTANLNWKDGKIFFEHSLNENGYEVVICKDNGVGMDEKIITNYFGKVGRSFYKSPEFEQERVKFREEGVDFEPCSQFGIGFMSCFMLGDQIRIETRKDYGYGKEFGKPLIVEINGIGGMIVIKEGRDDQPIGTTVKITSRNKPFFLDEHEDKVKLTAVLQGVALATEFPIYANCTIPEIEKEIYIPPEIESLPTLLEFYETQKIVTFEQFFSEINNSLNGIIRESFLIDENGIPTLSNCEGYWKGQGGDNTKEWKYHSKNKVIEKEVYKHPWNRETVVCIDGILLAGPPGRSSSNYNRVMRSLGHRSSNIRSLGVSLLDTRGNLKPEISPARTPLKNSLDQPGWKRLQEYIDIASGRIWENIAEYLSKGLSHEEFWKLGKVYGAWFPNMRHQKLWDFVAVPVVNSEDKVNWKKISELNKLSIIYSEKSQKLVEDDGIITPYSSLIKWEIEGENHPNFQWQMNILIFLMSSMFIENNKLKFEISYPKNPQEVLSKYIIKGSHRMISGFFLEFKGKSSQALTVQSQQCVINKNHPLSKIYFDSKYSSNKNKLQKFVTSFIIGLSHRIKLENKTKFLNVFDRWYKYIGTLYFNIDWTKYDDKLKPPYKVWTQTEGWMEITGKDLNKWQHI